MLRFVLLYHDCPAGDPRPSHWDLMLEKEPGGELLTWALPALPHQWRQVLLSAGTKDHLAKNEAAAPQGESQADRRITTILAQQLGEHRRAYLDYEGPVSGGRGEVRRVEQGTYEATAVRGSCYYVRLRGDRLRGELRLEQQPDEPNHWQVDWMDERG